MTNRLTRSTREAERRAVENINPYSMEYRSPLDPPEIIKRDGYEIVWIRHDIKGVDDFKVERYASEGYELVPKSRLGASVNSNPLERHPMADKWIIYKDLICMEAPVHIIERRRRRPEYIAEQRAAHLHGVTDDRFEERTGRNLYRIR